MLDNIQHFTTHYIPTIFHYSSDSEDDTMGSSSDSRRGTAMQRRDSSRSNSGGRRPRLLRSSATEPSITASTACRNALASPQTSLRATDLLNQVAISGSPPHSSSPLSQSPTMYVNPDRRLSAGDLADLEGFRPHLESNNYFSFPSFDAWEADRIAEEREAEMKSP